MSRLKQLFFDFFGGNRKPKVAPGSVFGMQKPPRAPAVLPPAESGPVRKAVAPDEGGTGASAVPGLAPELTALARESCLALGLHALAGRVRVRWNARLKTTAGTASPQTGGITLNCRLPNFGDAVVIRIFKHQLAHLVAHERAGRRRIAAHGMEWRRACAELGITGEKSRHTLPFESRPQRRKHAYQCPQCGEVVLRVRRLARYSACWSCCKAHSRGNYDERFRFVPIPLEKGVLIHTLHNAAR